MNPQWFKPKKKPSLRDAMPLCCVIESPCFFKALIFKAMKMREGFLTFIRYGLLMCMVLLVGFTPVSEQQGAKEITLSGGNRGEVLFPHFRHQEVIRDCSVCHQLFPREKGAIDRLKNDGTLQSKQVMNKLCVKCHREKAAAGENTGPKSCNACHVKQTPPIPAMR